MVPAVFVQLEKLPLTANGKVDRRALPEPVGLEEADSYCPPRDRLELQLTRIWESLLQVERVSVKDNFFDLGGHSLLAVKLLAHINQSLGRNLSVVSVFQAPTVEQMAQLVRQEGWKSPGESLVVVQPNGSKPPFFCVHGYAGYTGLAAHLGHDQPFYGLVQGLEGNRFYTRVEDLAAHYLKDVKALCPKGPYLLGGHSFGGLVAFEMAQQLRRAGEEVGLLALIDPTPPRRGDPQFRSAVRSSKRRTRSINNVSSRILHHLGQLLELPSGRKAAYARQRLSVMARLLGKNGKRLRCEMYLRVRRPMPPELRTFYIGEILFGDHYPAAAKAYRSQRYDGPAVLIHTGSNHAFDPEIVWRELIPEGLTAYTVPGKHLEILKEPLVAAVATHLSNYLQASQTQLVSQGGI
jgi:aspartate racemase